MKKLKVGIIGQGRSGRNIHVASLKRPKMLSRFEISAITDLIPERCNETASEFPGCKVCKDYREMLEMKELDLIVNASFSEQHVPITIEALEAGFHVLAEKPLGRTAQDVDSVIAAAEKAGKVAAVFQEARFFPDFRKVIEICRSGVLGRIVMARFIRNNFARRWDWQTLCEKNAGALLNTGSHSLDQALQLFGRTMPDRIYADMARVNSYGTAEDHIKMVFSKKGHPTIDFEVSSCAPYAPPAFQVYGEYGGITVEGHTVKWKYYHPEEAEERHLITEPLPGRKYCSEQLDWYEYSWQPPEHDTPWLGEQFYLNLYDVISNGAELEIPLSDVRLQIAIIEECHRQNPDIWGTGASK